MTDLDRSVAAARLDRLPRRTITDPALRAAAVAITVTEVPGEDHLGFVLTRRGAALSAHARQYALPGGRIDPGETAVDTARRELDEEVGIGVDGSAVLGCLDDYATRSGHRITPVVVWATGRPALHPAPGEVAEAFVVPLHELVRDDSPRWIPIAESDKPVLQLPILNRLLHAPTAAVLWQFAEVVLRDRLCRTDRVEEPTWAWR